MFRRARVVSVGDVNPGCTDVGALIHCANVQRPAPAVLLEKSIPSPDGA